VTPLVSICIPTYNAEKYIIETLISIAKQTYKNIEIIIGDNASSDNTEQLVKSFIKEHDLQILYYKNTENLGYSGNCNKLIGLANGEFIAIYHSDDIYVSTIVEEQVNILVDNTNISGCFTLHSVIDSNSVESKRWFDKLKHKKCVDVTFYDYNKYIDMIINHSQNPFFCPSSMVRKEAYNSVGGYNPEINFIEDQDMWFRLLENNQLAIINKKLVKYRIHEQQGSAIYSDITRETVSPMIEHIAKHLLTKFGIAEYDDKYKIKIDRLLAIDDIRFAFLLLQQNNKLVNFTEYKKFIVNSKGKYVLGLSDRHFLRFSIFQWMPVWFTFFCLNIMNKVKR